MGINAYDPSSGAILEGGEPLEVVDSDIIDYENIPMEEIYAMTSPMAPNIGTNEALMPIGNRSEFIDSRGLLPAPPGDTFGSAGNDVGSAPVASEPVAPLGIDVVSELGSAREASGPVAPFGNARDTGAEGVIPGGP